MLNVPDLMAMPVFGLRSEEAEVSVPIRQAENRTIDRPTVFRRMVYVRR